MKVTTQTNRFANKTSRRWMHSIVLAMMVILGAWAYAEVPRTIQYQGKLTNKTTGLPLSGNQNVTFRLYDSETAGTLLWQEQHLNAPVANGSLSVLLGSQTSLGLAFDKPYWLSIEVNNDGEMSPRERLASAPYAITSQQSNTSSGVAAPNYITGCEIEYVDAAHFRVMAGAFELNGDVLTRPTNSTPVDIGNAANWLHGSEAPNMKIYVYLGKDDASWLVKISDEAPTLSDTIGHTDGVPRYRCYATECYRYIGAVRNDGSSNLVNYLQSGYGSQTASSSQNLTYIKHYRDGFEGRKVDDNTVKITAGTMDIGGTMWTADSDSSDLALGASGNWLHGSRTSEAIFFVYVGVVNGWLSYKLSDEMPNTGDAAGITTGKLRYRQYLGNYWRAVAWGNADSQVIKYVSNIKDNGISNIVYSSFSGDADNNHRFAGSYNLDDRMKLPFFCSGGIAYISYRSYGNYLTQVDGSHTYSFKVFVDQALGGEEISIPSSAGCYQMGFATYDEISCFYMGTIENGKHVADIGMASDNSCNKAVLKILLFEEK